MSAEEAPRPHVVVVGAGFTGLSAAYRLARLGVAVAVLEAERLPGGLAAGFELGDGVVLERFYHHWFTSDRYAMDLVRELGLEGALRPRDTRTGLYYSNRIYRLSRPWDVLRFTALRPMDRLRLGALVLQARRLRDWRALEEMTAEQWLTRLAGREVYRVVWEPLLRGKFGDLAPEISAVWIWNKLRLRGGSRGRGGAERLVYLQGGFPALVRRLCSAIEALGGRIRLGERAEALEVHGGRVRAVCTDRGRLPADAVVLTPALPIVADLLGPHVPAAYVAGLRGIRYLANACLILELDRSLSQTYWLNVNDPGFPFVGVIEHTNFEPPPSYGGRHIVYLSRYLPAADPLFEASDEDWLAYCLPHLQRMFPALRRRWIRGWHVWRARHAQPVVTRGYGARVPARETPVKGVCLATMAQIYPEDRGTNYAIRDGLAAADAVFSQLRRGEHRSR